MMQKLNKIEIEREQQNETAAFNWLLPLAGHKYYGLIQDLFTIVSRRFNIYNSDILNV